MSGTKPILLVLFLVGCGSAPDEPTWNADVKHVLAANCIRCHAVPAIGGAPDGFRLDVYDNTVDERGRPVLGAGAMAEFIAVRASEGQMPPRFPLRERQRDVLGNWFGLSEAGQLAPKGEEVEGNSEPTMTILTDLGDPVTDESITLEYEIVDPDRDIVHGDLFAQDSGGGLTLISRTLHGGRDTIELDTGALVPGTYDLVAFLKDGNSAPQVTAGSIDIAARANTAPRVTVQNPGLHTIIADIDSPFTIDVNIADPDPLDTFSLKVDAIRGEDVVAIADRNGVGADNTIAWDTTALTESTRWRLRVTVSDGTATRTVWSQEVIISHQTTTLGFADVRVILEEYCGYCHAGTGAEPRIPFLTHRLEEYDPDGAFGVYDLRALIYRRVVLQKNMPPKSAELLAGQRPMPEDDRTTLAEWLLAGAPQ
jgi:hypothetical protein